MSDLGLHPTERNSDAAKHTTSVGTPSAGAVAKGASL